MAFRNPGKIIEYHGEKGTPLEGFWIKVRQVRTGEAYAALTRSTYWIDLHEAMAPYVIDWNFEGEIFENVEKPAVVAVGVNIPARTTVAIRYELLPPPAEGGPDIFNKVAVEVKEWILIKLRESILHRDDDGGASGAKGKVAGSSSAPGPDGEPSATPASTRKSRRSRKSSGTPSNAT